MSGLWRPIAGIEGLPGLSFMLRSTWVAERCERRFYLLANSSPTQGWVHHWHEQNLMDSPEQLDEQLGKLVIWIMGARDAQLEQREAA